MELTAKEFTHRLAEKGYTPGILLDVDKDDEPNTVKFTGAITFDGEGFMDFRNAEKYFDITCEPMKTSRSSPKPTRSPKSRLPKLKKAANLTAQSRKKSSSRHGA